MYTLFNHKNVHKKTFSGLLLLKEVWFLCLKLAIFQISLSKTDHCDHLVVNKDNARIWGLQAGHWLKWISKFSDTWLFLGATIGLLPLKCGVLDPGVLLLHQNTIGTTGFRSSWEIPNPWKNANLSCRNSPTLCWFKSQQLMHTYLTKFSKHLHYFLNLVTNFVKWLTNIIFPY